MANDPYAVLGVPRSATPEEIKAAYIAGAKKYHPDAIGAEASGEKMRELNLAYEKLRDAVPDPHGEFSASASGDLDGLESIVRVWAGEPKFSDLSAEKIATLNRERARMEQEGWKVERVHDHLVCTRTERKSLLSRPRKRRVTVNVDRYGRPFQVEQLRPD